MTGREKILAAFTPGGTPEIGVVTCYEGIFVRNHWFDLTDVPWYYAGSGVVEKELRWVRDFSTKTGIEWWSTQPCPSREERQWQRYEERQDGVWLVNGATGREKRLIELIEPTSCTSDRHFDLAMLPQTPDEIDRLIPAVPDFDREKFLAEGRHDVAARVREEFDLMTYAHISSPFWSLYDLLGYEGMMVLLAQDRQLTAYACNGMLRNLRRQIREIAAMGVDAVWIEECLTDQISKDAFSALNVPLVHECVNEIRACGLRSIYYYCGNPNDRLDAILEVGADAVHFEEGKKGFTVDIGQITRRIDGRCTVFGNLDSIAILQNGREDQLRAEIRKQLEAGATNGNRFVVSTGSPITPGTPVERVRLYTDLVRQMAG